MARTATARRTRKPAVLHLSADALRMAYRCASTVGDDWNARDSRWGLDNWQTAAVEIAMLPGVWQHLQDKAAESGNLWGARAYDHYSVPTRAYIDAERRPQCAGLPGYSMTHWADGTPASTVWDGIRRELPGAGDALYELQNLAYVLSPGCTLNDQYRASIEMHARERLVSGYDILVSDG